MQQPELYAAVIIPYIAAAIALLGRLVARRKAVHILTWEDYLATFAFMMGTGFTIISICKMRWGLGMPIKDINMPENLIYYHFFLDLWIDMWFYTFSVGLSKFVVLGLYWRTFSLSVTRWPIRILFVCSGCWLIVRVLLVTLQCQPIHKFWHQEVPGKCPIPAMMSLFGSSIPHFMLEVGILICPLYEISRLHVTTARKYALAAMFWAGTLVCFSALGSIIHTIQLQRMTNVDLTYNGIDDQI
ncbi:integral membrane [Pyrenophora seminiperda CCB06]|uniref:Integral membrane n=1 Tax=Pyrenophora seminiperda CCB06 TaxID=1302712 RepID=A0A3M7MD26_9PLEO|nr:integral membrane [Pyrenophora seminiperda CCB06]